jgi:hypothetical protein
MLDVVDRRRQYPFVGRYNTTGHIVRGEPGITPHHGNDGNADIREDVSWRAESGERPEQQHQDRHHDKCVRARKRDADNPGHGDVFQIAARASAASPPNTEHRGVAPAADEPSNRSEALWIRRNSISFTLSGPAPGPNRPARKWGLPRRLAIAASHTRS